MFKLVILSALIMAACAKPEAWVRVQRSPHGHGGFGLSGSQAHAESASIGYNGGYNGGGYPGGYGGYPGGYGGYGGGPQFSGGYSDASADASSFSGGYNWGK